MGLSFDYVSIAGVKSQRLEQQLLKLGRGTGSRSGASQELGRCLAEQERSRAALGNSTVGVRRADDQMETLQDSGSSGGHRPAVMCATRVPPCALDAGGYG